MEANTEPQSVNFVRQSVFYVRRKTTLPGHVRANRNIRSELTSSSLVATTDQAETDEYSLYHTQGHGTIPPILVDLRLNGKDISMELDTGATLSLVSEKTYHSLFSPDTAPQLKVSKAELKTYTGEVLNILGMITVTVNYKGQVADLNLLVVAGDGPSLMGRDWLSHIKLDWPRLNHFQGVSACQQILDKHEVIFKDELGSHS